MSEELYQFVACDYFATGEGRTICLLITRAYPKQDDYATESYFDETGFHLGELKNTAKFRAAREFVEHFGSYYAQGADNLSKEEFIEKFGRFISEVVLKLLNSEDQPGNLSFRQEFHFNFS
jgi:hypothetical protein